mgnify:CR=1 FL=1
MIGRKAGEMDLTQTNAQSGRIVGTHGGTPIIAVGVRDVVVDCRVVGLIRKTVVCEEGAILEVPSGTPYNDVSTPAQLV